MTDGVNTKTPIFRYLLVFGGNRDLMAL